MTSMLEPIESRSEETRARIFKRALSYINEHDVDKLTIRKLAEVADVSPALIIQYFGSKGNLLREAFTHHQNIVFGKFSETLNLADDADIRDVLSAYVRLYLTRDLAHPNLTLQVVMHSMTDDDDLKTDHDKRVEPMLQGIATNLKNHIPGLSQAQARVCAGTLALVYSASVRLIIKRKMTLDQGVAFLTPHLDVIAAGFEAVAARD